VEVRRQRAVIEANFHREVEARAGEQEARRRAQARFQLGMEAVDGYAALAGEGELLKDPRLEGLRRRLIDTALRFYTELQKSLEADPAPQAREQLAEAYARVGDLHDIVWSKDEAVADFRRALAIREALAASAPADPRQQATLTQVHLKIGKALRDIGRLGEALRSYERSLAIAEALVRDHPTDVSYEEQLSWCLQNLGAVQHHRGHPDEAIRSQQRVLAIREALARDDPASPKRLSALAWCQMDLGMALEAVGRREEALRRVTQAVAAHEELVRADPADVFYRERLATCLSNLVNLKRRAGAPEARRTLERIVAIREALARDNPTSFHYQVGLTWSYLALASEQAAADPGGALINIRKAERIVERSSHVNPTILYNLACAYAQCSAGARRGGGDLTPTERAAPEDCADCAMAALRRAVAAGYANVPLIRRDVDLDPLRSRRDFRELLMDLTFPADPFQR
jgi:tetratricopeptide (TPR) repeat protein